MNCVSCEDKRYCVNSRVIVYFKIPTVRKAPCLVKSSKVQNPRNPPHTRAFYLVNKPLSTAGVSEDNVQGCKIVQKINI